MAEELSNVFFKQPAFALVIGISEYENGVDLPEHGNLMLEPHQFPNLKLARKDAEDFAEFLKTHGFIGETVRTLFDEHADADAIKREFHALGNLCRYSGGEDPLVIVYFAGHGWADENNDHYLIPWDARCNELALSAISNATFSEYLSRLKTNKLAVFLDACHAGAMGMKEARGAQAHYDFQKGLGEGEGRYMIASCKPGQKSYEPKLVNEAERLKANGIFTGHLLRLLKCETDDIDEVEVDILNLYTALKNNVISTVHAQYGMDTHQEPLLKAEGDGLILAINQRAKRKKETLDEETKKQKLDYVERIRNRVWVEGLELKSTIVTTLESYVDEGKKEPGYDDFYGVFDEQFKQNAFEEAAMKRTCELLQMAYKSAFKRASQRVAKQSSPGETKAESQVQEAKPVDAFGTTQKQSLIVDGPQTTNISSMPAQQQEAKWQMPAKDRDYILEEIASQAAYFKQANTLRRMLNQPVGEADFTKKVLELGDELKEGDDLQPVLDDTVERFLKCWKERKKQPENAPGKLSDFLLKGR